MNYVMVHSFKVYCGCNRRSNCNSNRALSGFRQCYQDWRGQKRLKKKNRLINN